MTMIIYFNLSFKNAFDNAHFMIIKEKKCYQKLQKTAIEYSMSQFV